MHKSIADVVCQICQKAFKSNSELAKHFRKMHQESSEERYNLCNVCDIMVIDLQNHNRRVHTPDMEKCLICGKDVFDLKIHEDRVHQGKNKHFQCEVCGQWKLTKYEMRIHKSLVHDKKPIQKVRKCQYCTKECKSKRTFLKHVEAKHGHEKDFR